MRRTDRTILSILFVIALAVILSSSWACQPQTEEPAEEPMTETEEVEEPQEATAEEMDATTASAQLRSADGTEVGTVTFTETDAGVEMIADLHDLDGSGPHGIHVHETGECSAPDFGSAGGHFNPGDTDHSCPPATPRHGGDFGNIEIAEDGTGSLTLTSDLVTVAPGDASVVNKAVILHGGEDDCASQPSGDAGPRIACGVIALSGEDTMGEMATEEGETDDAGY